MSVENNSSLSKEPFAGTRYRKLHFNRESVLANAPQRSGVYGLFSALWVYIGETDDIRSKLLEHLAEREGCIAHYQPSGFAFELLEPEQCGARQAELSRVLQPLCSGRSFVYKAGN